MARILVLGAGGTGGYFGARLAESGADVTFLLRPASADRVRAAGIHVRSECGDARVPAQVLTADRLTTDYDLVLMCCKAYDIDAAVRDVSPAVGPGTTVLPLLNGLDHLRTLDAAFGRERVLGGVCYVSVDRGPGGEILHRGREHEMILGARAGDDAASRLCPAIARGGFQVRLSHDIIYDMWDKYIFIATLAGTTCLFRADVGTILETDHGEDVVRAMLAECQAVARAGGHTADPRRNVLALRILTARGSTLTSSMLRDISAGRRTEAHHILARMVERAAAVGLPVPLLRTAWSHLQAYEKARDTVATISSP